MRRGREGGEELSASKEKQTNRPRFPLSKIHVMFVIPPEGNICTYLVALCPMAVKVT